ncbi:MAG: tRNA-guanine transglycosylase, partial [Patescibacteria group bacterium]
MFKVLKKDYSSRARLGIIETPHGIVETPSYVVVGTHAKVRELSSQDLVRAKTQLIISNTYHMWQKLGDKGLRKYPGLHESMNWQRPLMTDSGGFQVFSLGFARELGGGKIATSQQPLATSENLVRITDDGAYFQVDSKEYFLDAKKSVWIQEKLGADIILAFDEP